MFTLGWHYDTLVLFSVKGKLGAEGCGFFFLNYNIV